MKVIKRNGRAEELDVTKIRKVIQHAMQGFDELDPMELELDAKIQFRDGMTTKEIQQTLIQTAIEKTSVEEPNWQFVAARLLAYDLYKEAALNRGYCHFGYGNYAELVQRLVDEGLYGEYLLEHYTKEQLEELGAYIKPERDDLFNYVGLKLLADRYLVKGFDGEVLELPQERFMTIAITLAIPEKPEERVYWAKKFYDVMSKLEMTVATPTLANAGTPHPQLSSCFIDTVDDSLDGIMNTAWATAKVSKHGGGVGIYLGKIRSRGSDIRGHKGASGGVMPWSRIYNQIAVSVDQLGQRAGAFALYLDVWHRDILTFLEGRLNNGDDRLKFHDVFPAVCIPDIFMKRVKSRGQWTLFDPHEVRRVMGYSLEDFWGEEFEKRYVECERAVKEGRLKLVTEVPAIEVMKKIMVSHFETGTPFLFFRDTVNKYNPNKHQGMVYSSNLCTEIIQNMSPTKVLEETLDEVSGEIEKKMVAGDFVVCNLSSLNLGRVLTFEDIARVVPIEVRMLDNVVSLNIMFQCGIPKQAVYTNIRYRAIGVGTFGYHQHLALKGISWESEEHLEYADKLYEEIAYWAIRTSAELAKERGEYPLFHGSDWETGEYFDLRGYTSERWQELKEFVRQHGMRNGYVMAIAPTGSTSLIAGSTASIEPVFAKFWIEEKRGAVIPQTAPNLNQQTFWLYKEAHKIDQMWSIKAAGRRQRHIDQSQSFNLYITPDITARQLLDYYMAAWENGLKTVYYVRNQTVEVEDCVSCSS